MAVNCGPSFGLCGLRATLLDDLGNVHSGSNNKYVSDKQISLAFTPNVDTGTTFSQRNGCGCSLARFKAEDVFNWWDFTLTDGAIEPGLEQLLVGGTPIHEGLDVVGLHFPAALDCSQQRQLVALEAWTQHMHGSKKDSSLPYIHWVFPASVWQYGGQTADEAFMTPVLTGFSRSNDLWGHGPYGDGPPDGSNVGAEGAYWKTDEVLPVATCDPGTVTPGS